MGLTMTTTAPGAPVTAWADDIDQVLAGDLIAALTVTTASGDVVTVPTAPLGLRDRGQGWVSCFVPARFAGRLDQPGPIGRVALTFLSRAHGTATSDAYLLVQGHAEAGHTIAGAIHSRASELLEPALVAAFRDGWRGERRHDAIGVRVRVHRITTWSDARASGIPTTLGAAAAAAPLPQPVPSHAASGVDARNAVRRFRGHPHRLLSYAGGDGFPVTIPVRILEAGEQGIRITAPAGTLPAGDRRAGLLALSYGPRLTGLSTRHHTGWLSKHKDGTATYVPHSGYGHHLPQSKALRLLAGAKHRVLPAR
ncbi:hypothetical protein AB0F72_27535 [Actinoplanes sp. NPDC023936]|uniref:hypothetical protein n=1 Tax=Actinoplanes sp. NPDC023936 TaxID=3154910 RepID=UPI0033E61101